MAKKLITKGVDSSVLVKNLNSELLNDFNSDDIIGKKIPHPNNTNIGYLVELKEISLNGNQQIYFKIEGHCRNSSPAYVLGEFYYYYDGKGIIDAHINNVSGSLIDKAVVYIEDGVFKIYLHKAYRSDLNLRMYVYDENKHKDLIENIKHIRTEEDIPDFGINYREMTLKYSAENNTGKVFDIVDLPSNVSTLDLNTLPPIANVSTIILRYNGVVQDLDTYISQVEEPVMPLPMSEGIEVNAEIPSTLELTPGIMPMINLDDYVGATKGYLRIYVPHRYIYDYRKRYPKLSAFFFKLDTRVPYDIMMGGVNLLKNTKTFKNWTLERDESIVDGYNDFKAVYINVDIVDIDETNVSGDIYRRLTFPKVELEYESYYTISFYGKGSNVVFLTNNVAFCVDHNCGERARTDGNNLFQTIVMTPEWKRYYITYLTSSSPNGSSTFDTNIQMRVYNNHNNATICGLKLEKGFIPSEWTPAPEDIDAQFDEVYDEIEETYAKKDGAYEGLLAGTALNLQGQHNVINNSMYRPTAGTLDINWEAAEIEEIQGNSIAWNQLIKNGNFADDFESWRAQSTAQYSISDGVITFNNSLMTIDQTNICKYVDLKANHKYLAVTESKAENDDTYGAIFLNNTYFGLGKNSKFTRRLTLISFPEDYNGEMQFRGEVKEIGQEIKISYKNIQLFDLTLIYGLGNEPSTTEQFEEDYQNWFGKYLEYEEYDEGSIRNVQATGLRTVGFNISNISEYTNQIYKIENVFLYDNNSYDGQIFAQMDYEINGKKKHVTGISVKGKKVKTLQISWGNLAIYLVCKYIDGTVHYIINESNAYENSRDTVNFSNICVNYVWSGNRNGEYEEHWEETRTLPLTTLSGKLNGEGESVVIFSDGMKRAGDAYDEIKVENGVTKAIKRIGTLDLGTLTWFYLNNRFNSYVTIKYKKPDTGYTYSNVLSPKYIRTYPINGIFEDAIVDKAISFLMQTDEITLTDSSFNMDTDALKEALQGQILYYELAEPEVYIVDEFQLPLTYRVDDYGTEQVISPEGTVNPYLVTRYGVNAVDTIRRLPQNYVSEKSINNLLSQLNSVMNGTWSKTWNDITNSYDFSFLPNEVQDSSQPNEELP